MSSSTRYTLQYGTTITVIIKIDKILNFYIYATGVHGQNLALFTCIEYLGNISLCFVS